MYALLVLREENGINWKDSVVKINNFERLIVGDDFPGEQMILIDDEK